MLYDNMEFGKDTRVLNNPHEVQSAHWLLWCTQALVLRKLSNSHLLNFLFSNATHIDHSLMWINNALTHLC